MKYLPLLIIILFISCASIQNPQNWDDDIDLQEEFQRITEGREYSWQGDTLTITDPY